MHNQYCILLVYATDTVYLLYVYTTGAVYILYIKQVHLLYAQPEPCTYCMCNGCSVLILGDLVVIVYTNFGKVWGMGLLKPQFVKILAALGGGVCPARARRATFVLSIPALTPDSPSPGGAPKIDQSGLQTFRYPLCMQYVHSTWCVCNKRRVPIV